MKMQTTLAPKPPVAPVARTSLGLRAAIFDEMDAIRNGSSNPTRANAIAKLAATLVDSVRMEIELSKYLRSIPPVENASGDQNTIGLMEQMKLA
jgi:hypothetical protein